MQLVLMTGAVQATTEVLPALGLLPHSVTVLPLDAGRLVEHTPGDAILIDARRDLAEGRAFTRVLAALGRDIPVLVRQRGPQLQAVPHLLGLHPDLHERPRLDRRVLDREPAHDEGPGRAHAGS